MAVALGPAQVAARPVFVSLDGAWDEPAARELCESLIETIGLTRDFEPPTTCAQVRNRRGAQALAAARRSGKHLLFLQVRQLAQGELELRIEPWDHLSQPSPRLSWTVRQAPGGEELMPLRRRVRYSLSCLRSDRGVPGLALLRTAADSSRLVLAANNSSYLDLATGEPVDFDHAWRLYREDDSRSPDYLGATLELGGVLALGEVWYLTDTSISSNDWKYDVSWKTLEKKFITGQGLQFDDNALFLNSPGHPAAGAVYYGSARHHGLNVVASLLASATATSAWEYFTEFREIAAINDLVMTPVGGLAFGEPLFQLSDFFRRSEPTLLNRVLSALFSFPSSLNPVRDRDAPGGLRLVDSRGLAVDKWHRFSLLAGFDLDHAEGMASSAMGGSLRFEAQILGDEQFGRPGRFTQLSAGTLSTRMHLGASLGGAGLQDLAILGENAYAGFWGQQLVGTEDGTRGATGLAGVAALFEHEERYAPGLVDQAGVVSPAGLTLQGTLAQRSLRLSIGADLYPVFGSVFSQAWPTLALGSPAPSGASAALKRRGYYWGYGLRGSARLALEYGNAGFGLEMRHYSLLSAERLWPRKTLADLSLADQRQLTRVWLAHALPAPGLWLRASFERSWRASEAGEVESAADDSRVHLQLVWDF